MRGRSDETKVHVEYFFGESGDEWMSAVQVFAFPAPAEGGEHVERHPDVFERDLALEVVAVRHVAVEDDHGGDVEGDGGDEEGDVGEADELVVDDDDVVGHDDRCRRIRKSEKRRHGDE